LCVVIIFHELENISLPVANQDLDFQRHVVVRFVDIGGIVDHHCLNFLSIKKYTLVLVCA
jgi:hypothetical protein